MEQSEKSNAWSLAKNLVHRSRKILFQTGWGRWRISRGEYVVSNLLLSVLITAVTLPLSFLWWAWWLFLVSWIGVLVVSLVNVVFQVSLVVKRLHDLWHSWKYVGIPFLVCIVGLAGGLILVWTFFGSRDGLFWMVAGGVMLLFFLWFLYVGLRLVFVTGKAEENIYGPDPLLDQPKNNLLYRGVAIVLFLVMWALSLYIEQEQPMDSFQNVINGYIQSKVTPEMIPQMP